MQTAAERTTANSNAEMGATEALVKFASGLRYEAIPESARHAARRHSLDTVGAILAGSRQRATRIVERTLIELGTKGTAAVPGLAPRFGPLAAAYIGGTAGHGLELDDGYRPDVVIAIARGGLTVAGALAYALGVKHCGSMNVAFYTGVDERLDVPVVLPPTLDLVDVRGLRVLVADDVADTGHTLRLVREVLAQHVAEARTAVLYRKPRSVVAPDYAWRETDQWIVFPWSARPPPCLAPS